MLLIDLHLTMLRNLSKRRLLMEQSLLHDHTDLPTEQPVNPGLEAKFGQPINWQQHILYVFNIRQIKMGNPSDKSQYHTDSIHCLTIIEEEKCNRVFRQRQSATICKDCKTTYHKSLIRHINRSNASYFILHKSHHQSRF